MGGIGYIIGGALSGLGDGLEKQTILNDQDQRAAQLQEMQTRRETALAALNHQYRTGEAVAASDLADRNAARNDARDFAYGTKKEDQKQTYEQQNIRLKGTIDLQNNETIKELEHKYNLSEGAADDARELQKQLTLNGVTADHWEVTKDGQLVAFNKEGGILRYSTGDQTYVPTRTSVSDTGDAGGSIAGEAAARGKTGGSKPQRRSAVAQPNASAQDSSILAQLSRMPPPPDGRVGATMTGPNGMKASWNGRTWVLADQTGG